MTGIAQRSGPPPRVARADNTEVAAVADNVTSLMRTFTKARATMLAAAAHDVEWSAHVLLKQLSVEGSMRAGALADCLRSDPSTISRQVAALVKEGLVERRSDPDDGRASLLVLTPKADQVLAEHDEIRLGFFAQMLSKWDHDDLSAFARLLERFNADYLSANNDWLADKIAAAHSRSGGTP